jgi:hypothetical protein
MKKLIIAAAIALVSLNASADSCEKIINYSIGHMVSNGASADVVKYRDVYEQTCTIAEKARQSMGKEEFKRAIINGSSHALDQGGKPDAADTNTLVAAISYDYAGI